MPILGELISLGTALCWTVTVVSFEYAGKRVGSLPVNIIRLLFAFVFLGITLLFMDGSIIPQNVSDQSVTLLMVSGFIGLVIGDLFLFQAFVDVGGRISLLIMSSVPPLSAILGYIIFGEIIQGLDMIGMCLTIGAIIFVIISKQEQADSTHPHLVRGIIFAFVGALSQSIGVIISKQGIGELHAFEATQIRIIAAIIGFTVFIFIRKEWGNVGLAFTKKDALLFIILGSIFGPFLGVTSSLWALEYTSIGIASTISQLNIIMIMPFSILFFKERISIKELLGSIVAIIGVILILI